MAKLIRSAYFEPRMIARLKKLEDNPKLSKDNHEIIHEFKHALESGDTLRGKKSVVVGTSASYRYIGYLIKLAEYWNKPFLKVTRADVSRFNGDLNTDKFMKQSGEPYSDNSKADWRKAIRKFFNWLYCVKLNQSAQFSEVADWLSLSVPERDHPTLNKEDIDRVVAAVPLRTKVLFLGLFDSGCRIQEWLNLRISDILNLDLMTMKPLQGEYFKIRIRPETSKASSGNGGKGRTFSLFLSTPLIGQWLLSHPLRKEDGTLNPDERLYPMSYAMARKTLRQAGDRYLKRRVWPHLLRHASADYWVTRIKNRYRFCDRFGWAYSSDMPDRYLSKQGTSDEETVKEFEVRSLGDLKGENQEMKQKLAILEDQNLKLASKLQEFIDAGSPLDKALAGKKDLMEQLKKAVIEEMKKDIAATQS